MRRRYKILLSFGLVIVCAVFAVSYFTFHRLVVSRPTLIHGRDYKAFVKEVHELLAQKHPFQLVHFTSEDGVNLAGLWIKREKPTATMVVCHGFRCCKETMYEYADLFPNFNILFFDFRAHGKSNGEYITFGFHEYKDVLVAAHWAKKRAQHEHRGITPMPLVVLGVSMGGASALLAAEFDKDLADALVIDSTYADLLKTLGTAFTRKAKLPRYPFMPVLKQMLHFWGKCEVDMIKPVRSVEAIDKPILFIHSCLDMLITPDAALALYAASKNKSTKIWVAPTGRHGFVHREHPEWYAKKVTHFLRKAGLIV